MEKTQCEYLFQIFSWALINTFLKLPISYIRGLRWNVDDIVDHGRREEEGEGCSN